MNSIKKSISKEEWLLKVEALKSSTDRILNLPHNWQASNGWGLKELFIHLQAWDEEYLGVLKGCLSGESYLPKFCRFPNYKREDQMVFVNLWNDQILNERKSLSLESVKEEFFQTRQKVLKEFSMLWTDKNGLRHSFAIQIDDLSTHDIEHVSKGIKSK
jgi:hypothetical protein